ncbi:proline dehydrogenase family protein [bacterium]|nr:proline dehydrogenase family protein [bacterium]
MNLLNKAIVTALPLAPKPIVGYFSRRYIAGSKLQNALDEVKRLNDEGMCATVDVLGESINRTEEADEAVNQYLKALEAIDQYKLDANISVKPTQLALMLNFDKCVLNYSKLLETAAEFNNFVRIDMEDSSTTSRTIGLYLELRKNFDNTGVVFQAYLRRTYSDLTNLSSKVKGFNFRLCKGIYIEPRTIAWKHYDIVRENYKFLLKEALNNGIYTGIATHDEYLVHCAFSLIEKMNLPKERYEFQMLLGVDTRLRKIIVDAGHKLRVYVPFGEQWYAYSTRRLKENPQIAGHVMKAVFQPGGR